MDWSWTLGTVRGVRIRVHLTFALVLIWAAYHWSATLGRGVSGAAFGVALTCILFACVVVHELAHGLVATRFGLDVNEIELSPIGGVVKIDAVPGRPRHEFWMALAGPLANVAIAVPLGVAVLWMLGHRLIVSQRHLLHLLTWPSWQAIVLNLFAANVLLAAFTLIPAFPMDGGRLLRSLVAWRTDLLRATRFAAQLGQGLAVVTGLGGFVSGNPLLLMIALMVFWGAHQERRFTEMSVVLGDACVGESVMHSFDSVSPSDSLGRVVQKAIHGAVAPYPVLESGRLVGWLRGLDIRSAL